MYCKIREVIKKITVVLVFLMPLGISGDCNGGKGIHTETTIRDRIRWPGNPVFSSADGKWDSERVLNPTVIEDSIFKMWYVGISKDGRHRIGYATSPDAILWTRYKENNCPSSPGGDGCVLDISAGSAWDGDYLYNANVLIDPNAPSNERYKIWYTGVDVKPAAEEQKWRTGYATSPDGTKWTRYKGNKCQGNPVGDGCVFDVGESGSWDDDVAGAPSVMIDIDASPDERYKMWYEGCIYSRDPLHTCWIGYATSPDGVNWTRYKGNKCQGNPVGDGCVLDIGDSGNWDSLMVIQPTVLKTTDGQYIMWYGGVQQNFTIRIGYATSPDGVNWTRYKGNKCQGNPVGDGCVFDTGNMWENRMVRDPHVVKSGNKLVMWYTGRGNGSRIGLAYIEIDQD